MTPEDDAANTFVVPDALAGERVDRAVALHTGWSRAEVRSSRIRNYDPHPNHWMNRRLEDVWLSEK